VAIPFSHRAIVCSITMIIIHSCSLYIILGFGWRSDNVQCQKYAKIEKIRKGANRSLFGVLKAIIGAMIVFVTFLYLHED
jgi:hypothetical protein